MNATESLTLPPTEAVGFFILKHFLVDLSVESPFGRVADESAIAMGFQQEIAVLAQASGEPDTHRVDLRVRLTAQAGEQAVFLLELTYRVEVRLQNVLDENRARMLEVEVPEAVSATLRAIMEQCGTFAGYPEMRVAGLGFDVAFEKSHATTH
jgi:preprotein translocase subunit SecB